MIETSHIAFHIWDEEDPGLIQFDLYTCGLLNLSDVLLAFGQEFDLVNLDYKLFDRENGFALEKEGSFPRDLDMYGLLFKKSEFFSKMYDAQILKK